MKRDEREGKKQIASSNASVPQDSSSSEPCPPDLSSESEFPPLGASPKFHVPERERSRRASDGSSEDASMCSSPEPKMDTKSPTSETETVTGAPESSHNEDLVPEWNPEDDGNQVTVASGSSIKPGSKNRLPVFRAICPDN